MAHRLAGLTRRLLPNPALPEGARPQTRVRALVGIALLAQAGLSFTQQGVAVLAFALGRVVHAGPAAVGGLVSAVSVGMMVGNLAGGAVVDRAGPRPVAVAAAAGLAAVLVAFGLVVPGSYLVMAVWLVPVGLLVAPGAMAGARAVFGATAPARRGLAMSIRQTGVMVGAAAAAAWLPLMAASHGLGATFLLMAAVGLAPALILGAVIPPGRAGPREPRGGTPQLGGVLVPVAVSALLAAGQYDLITYTLVDLTRRVGMSLSMAGITLGIVQLGGIGGRLLLGWLSDRWGRPGAVALAAAWGALLFATLAILPRATPTAVRDGVMFLLGWCAVGWNGVCLTWVGEAGGGGGTGFKLGLGASAVFFGATLFPPLFGLVVSATGDWAWGWLMLAGQFLVAGALAVSARRPRARRRAREA